MIKVRTLSLLMLLTAITKISAAQSDSTVDMADTMRSNGRIYVVVAVVVLILVGLFVYLFRLDKKISRLEKDK
jgi:CcmD family protein